MNIFRRYILLVISVLLLFSIEGSAQYLDPTAAGTMRSTVDNQRDSTYYDDTTSYKPNFTFKKYFNSLAHKDTMTISNMYFGAMVVPGTGQWYNKDYWKVPVVYGLLGGSITGAVVYNKRWKHDGHTKDKDLRNIFIYTAVASYWGQLLDATVRFHSYDDHLPARASLYSALVPGLGQAYNGDYWHIPIYYAGFMISGYSWAFNQKQYRRYRGMLKQVAEGTYSGRYSQSDLIWYRDSYRRNRDYSVVSTLLIYILNIIDANVFAHFTKFDISDDISININPTIVQPTIPSAGLYTYTPNYRYNKFGFQMSVTF